jgi:hypothetical protein
MQTAWRERDPQVRIKAAREALEKSAECAPAYILLAEEETQTIVESEKLLKSGLKAAESAYRKSQQFQHQNNQLEALHRRDTNVLIYMKRRLAMCARKLGKLREATKMMRDLIKEFPLTNVFNIHENLIEALLEMQAYADVQAVLAKYDGRPAFASLSPLNPSLRRHKPPEVGHHLLHGGAAEGARSVRQVLARLGLQTRPLDGRNERRGGHPSRRRVQPSRSQVFARNQEFDPSVGTHPQERRLRSHRLRLLPSQSLETRRRSAQPLALHVGRQSVSSLSHVCPLLTLSRPQPSV